MTQRKVIDQAEIQRAREATTRFRDVARATGMHHRERDPLVMVIHRVIDFAEAALRQAAGRDAFTRDQEEKAAFGAALQAAGTEALRQASSAPQREEKKEDGASLAAGATDLGGAPPREVCKYCGQPMSAEVCQGYLDELGVGCASVPVSGASASLPSAAQGSNPHSDTTLALRERIIEASWDTPNHDVEEIGLAGALTALQIARERVHVWSQPEIDQMIEELS